MDRFIVISGCSGGGKSTLLEELRRRGHQVVEEPGRRIVVEELGSGGSALPWADAPAFARRAMEMSIADRSSAAFAPGLVFFDRGLIDAAAALQHLTGEATLAALRQFHRYNKHVFLTPPWPEIYVADRERRHDLSAAVAEYDRLRMVYPSLGYQVHILPKVHVEERADFVLSTLNSA
ncbi:AAA family ATPase [Rhizobium mayense]|uniref:AAA family ATPase n=1 Tax=Rhizobium mayense TaxID=1312184 RepID=A0ABT7JW13_9HYPH|nr:AAA family ATPase [Rhizobium mayense]MDL2400536.1 AAA family ATPase [Rhizobium mayense]